MSRRLLVAAAIIVLGFTGTRTASAQTPVTNVQLDLLPMVARGLAAPASKIAASAKIFGSPSAHASNMTSEMKTSHSSMVMPALYAATFGLQMMDVRSTLTAFNNGAVEGNPLMSGIVKSKAGFVAFKAGIAMSAIFSAHQMAKHSKVRAIITLAAINSAYAMVVAHNYQVAASMRR